LQSRYKAQVRMETGDLNDLKENKKREFEEARAKKEQLDLQIEAFKRAFMEQNRQIKRNKEWKEKTQRETETLKEQKNFLEKVN